MLGGFDSLLALDTAIIVRYSRDNLVLKYTIPQSLCMSKIAGSSQVGIGAILAVADVFTTLALIATDSDHRPGIYRWLIR